jgi:chorismate mutase
MTPQERAEFIAELKAAMHQTPICLSEEEQQWVRMAIQREAQSIALRRAIIEKTLASLAWSAVVGLGLMFMSYLKDHGWK